MSPTKSLSFNQLILAILLSSIMVVLSIQHRLDFLVSPINTIISPLRQPLVAVNLIISRQTSFIHSLPHQYRIIEDLKRQNAALSVTAKMAEELKKENDSLKAQIQAPSPIKHQLLPAKVIGITRHALINQGEKSSLKPGLVVIKENIILGTIISVTPNTAKVRLIEDADTQIPSVTLNGVSGSTVSQNGQLRLTQILQKDVISKDEPIFTKGSESIPPGLLIGNITSIDTNPSNVYQTAVISPAISLKDQDVVFVLIE